MKQIEIGAGNLPLWDFMISRTAALGITDSGKTYGCKGIAEQILDAGEMIIVFDAIGVWRHLKSPGKGPHAKGYPVVVAGGNHPDLPLTPASAPSIVRAAIHNRVPLIIDLYDPKLSKADWRRIVQASFRILLYENKQPIHAFLEESAEFAPQKVMDGETYAEVEKLARMGGNASVGITFINQRAQELNKAVLELCDNLILFRQRGSHAIGALQKWLDQVSPDMSQKIATSLPHMTQGDCWVWAKDSAEPVRTRTHLLKSFHPDRRAGASAAPAASKSVDTGEFVAKLSGELGKLIEEAKANDPGELKRELARLRAEITKANQNAPKPKIEIKEVAVFTKEELSKFREHAHSFGDELRTFNQLLEKLDRKLELFSEKRAELPRTVLPVKTREEAVRFRENISQAVKLRRETSPKSEVATTGATSISRSQQRIIDALREFQALGLEDVDKRQLAIFCGASPNSSGYQNNLGALRSMGAISYPQPGTAALTEEGRRLVLHQTTLGSLSELHELWLRKLPASQGDIFRVLVAESERVFRKEELAEAVGKSAQSSGFQNNLGALRTLGVLDYPQPGCVKISELVFPPGLPA